MGDLLLTSVGCGVEEAAVKGRGQLEGKQLPPFFPLRHHTEDHGLRFTLKCPCSVDSTGWALCQPAADPPWPAAGAGCVHFTFVLWGPDYSSHNHSTILGFLTCPSSRVTHMSRVALAGQGSWWQGAPGRSLCACHPVEGGPLLFFLAQIG